jgi:hypothetical protein
MDIKIIVQARISIEVQKKLESIVRIPRKEWHKRNLPDYYGNFITQFTETIEFQNLQKAAEHRTLMLQKDAELRTAKADASNSKLFLSLKNAELESVKKQLESLKKQIEELKRPTAA